ncbi:Uncharacterised protein [Achromobacter xylosoxidans]|nr:Uncharacterised protein [Achromobacter xylosoxidans]
MIEIHGGVAGAEQDIAGVERARAHGRLPHRRANVDRAGGPVEQERILRQRDAPRVAGADVDNPALRDRQAARARPHAESQRHCAAVVPGGTGAADDDIAAAAHAAHETVDVRDGTCPLDHQRALALDIAHPELAGVGPGRAAPRHQDGAIAILETADDAIDAAHVAPRQDRYRAAPAFRPHQQGRAIDPARPGIGNRHARRVVALGVDRGELVRDRAAVEDAQLARPATADEQVIRQGPGRTGIEHADPGRGARNHAGIDPPLRGAQDVEDHKGSARDRRVAGEARIVALQLRGARVMIELVPARAQAVQRGREDHEPDRIEVERAGAGAKTDLRRIHPAGGIGGHAAGRGADVDDAGSAGVAAQLDPPQAIRTHRDRTGVGQRQRAVAAGADDQAAIHDPGRAQARDLRRPHPARRQPQPAAGAAHGRPRGGDLQRTGRGIADDEVIGIAPVHHRRHVTRHRRAGQRL